MTDTQLGRTPSPRYRDPIHHHAQRRPGKLAILDVSSGTRLNYAELHQRIGRLAALLHERGVSAGARVAILAPNSPAFFELQYAASHLGAIMVPLNIRLTEPELSYILQDAAPQLLIFDQAFADLAQALQERAGAAVAGLALDYGQADCAYEQEMAVERAVPVAHEATHDDTCLIIYTSGTTGRPKGARITHGGMFWQRANTTAACTISHKTVELVLLPMFHIAGLNANSNSTLSAGGTLVVRRAFDAADTLRLLSDAQLGINNITGVTAQFMFLAQHPDFASADLSRLSYVGVGGSPTPASLLKVYADLGIPMCEGFGMTEAGPGIATVDPEAVALKRGSIGKALLYVDTRLVDATGVDVSTGEVGELWIRGPNVTPGYWNSPAANAASFVHGWFRTGDLMRKDEDGYLYVVDRLKDMYISGGENVYPAEVERAIQALEGVADAAVVGTPHPRWGESGHAFIVREPKASITAEQVLAHCALHLAKFKCPGAVDFVDALPRTASGKVLKSQLRQEAAASTAT